MAKRLAKQLWVELPGSEKRRSTGSKVGALRSPDEVFTVLMRLRRRRALSAAAKAGGHLTHEEYAARYAAREDDIDKVKEFAKNFHLQVDAILPVERSVLLKGTVADFSKAFRLELKTHKLANGQSYRGREGKIFIPAALKGAVIGVFGLDDRPVVHPHVRWGTVRASNRGGGGSFQTPAKTGPFYGNQLAELYNFPAGTDGTGQTIGIVEIGGGFKQADLNMYFQKAGIGKIPNITVVTVPNGGSNTPQPNNKQLPDVEVLLDMEVAGSAAPGANLVMYFGKSGTTQQTLLAVTAAVHDQKNDPSVLSLSWGGDEYDSSMSGETGATMEQQYQDNMNDVFQSAQSLGITVCVSSGDSGSAGAPLNDPQRPWDGHAHVSFPASSPYVLAVGGTHIVGTQHGPSEETWHPSANVGTGGGISRYFALPDYQNGTVNQNAVNPAGGPGRGVPDISADAAQQSGYYVLVDGMSFPGPKTGTLGVGGTSAACPLWAALIARLNQALNIRLGFVNPALYRIGATPGVFHDIKKGNNGDYKAGVGWDPCTGLGTPDGEALLAALKPATANKAIAMRAAASIAQRPLRDPGKIEKPTPEQISGEIERRLIEFDPKDARTYFGSGIANAQVSSSLALTPIPWPSGKAPKATPLGTPPDPDAALGQYDYLIVTWTLTEAQALADVLTPGYPSKTAWYPYTHNFNSEFVPIIQPDAPSVKDSHRLGSYFPTTIAGKRVLCFKSELHLNQDGPKLPIVKLWQQLILEVQPKLLITTGTGGGIGSYIQLGDVAIAPAVRFDCITKFKSQKFAHAVYPCSTLAMSSLATAETLFAANAKQLPAASRLPKIITNPEPGVPSADVVTTDFFAYDDVTDRYGLQGLGAICDEGDAALGLAIKGVRSRKPKWVAVRNASDPQIQDEGMTPKQGYELATGYFGKFGYWTTVPSAITCWALVIDN